MKDVGFFHLPQGKMLIMPCKEQETSNLSMPETFILARSESSTVDYPETPSAKTWRQT